MYLIARDKDEEKLDPILANLDGVLEDYLYSSILDRKRSTNFRW